MSNENALKEELDRERQKSKELEQKLQKHSIAEAQMQEELRLLQEKLVDTFPGASEKNIKTPKSPILRAASRENEENGCEAITDLHFGQVSSPGSSNARGPTNSGSSSSFEVIERSPALHSKGGKETQTLSPDTDPKHSLLVNLKEPERMSARMPVQSSVQHDSRLTWRPAGREGNSRDLDKVNFSHGEEIKDKELFEKGIPISPNSWPQQSDPWSGTGARPKNISLPTNNSRREDSEMNRQPENQLFSSGTEPKVGLSSKMLVQIPDEGGTFRINHLPPINYGQDISLTGLSSIYQSSGDEMPRTVIHTAPETEVEGLNDLNSGTSRSSDKSLPSTSELLRKGDVNALFDVQQGSKAPREEDLQHGTKASQEEEKLLISFSSPFQSSDAGVISQPQVTNEDVTLANQLGTLLLEIKAKLSASEEVLDRFTNFTHEVAKLETRLKYYQAQIQKQQAHSASLQVQVQSLGKETEDLRQLLHIPSKQAGTPSLGQESEWVSVAANDTGHKDQGNKAVEEKLRELTTLNNQLFFVNTQWEERWKQLELQFSSQYKELDNKKDQLMKENQELRKENQQLVKENQDFKGQTDVGNQLNDEMKTLKHEKHELEQKFKVQESHLLKERRVNNQMRAKLEMHHHSRKEDMEIKNKELTDEVRNLKTENVALKDQLTVNMEDYHQEKKERTMFENQAKKYRLEVNELKRNHDTKLKTANLMIKKREEEIFKKDKTIGDLQRINDDLNGKLRTAERRTVLQMPSMFQGSQPSDVFCPSASPAYNPSQMKYLQKQEGHAENPGEILVSSHTGLNDNRYQAVTSAEHSPEAWECKTCTFVNFSDTNICQMCTSARLTESSMSSFSTLHSRDEWPGRDVPDSPEQIDVT